MTVFTLTPGNTTYTMLTACAASTMELAEEEMSDLRAELSDTLPNFSIAWIVSQAIQLDHAAGRREMARLVKLALRTEKRDQVPAEELMDRVLQGLDHGRSVHYRNGGEEVRKELLGWLGFRP